MTATAETDKDEVERLARVHELAATGKARQLRGHVSAAAIARAAGVSHNAVLRWEKGLRRPSGAAGLRYLDVLDALARVRKDQ